MYVLGLDNSVSASNLGGCAKKKSKAERFNDPKDHSLINRVDLILIMGKKFKSIS